MNKQDLRIVFMGTPEFAVPSLKLLVEGGYNVVAVVTQPDKPVGRHGSTLQAPPVKQYALSKSIPVLQPERMKDEDFLCQLRAFDAHLQVVVAFRMLPKQVWNLPPFGTFNVHAALLPQYRGAAPINWAVINGETETGVTTFFLDEDIDTGRIISHKRLPIPDNANVEWVYNHLMSLGAELCIETVDRILQNDGKVESTEQPQDLPLKHAPKIFKETCQIDWNQPTKRIYDFIRGLSPYPGAWTEIQKTGIEGENKPQVLKIFSATKTQIPANAQPGTFVVEGNRLLVNTADNLLELQEIQLAGKKRIASRDFLNGTRDANLYRAISK